MPNDPHNASLKHNRHYFEPSQMISSHQPPGRFGRLIVSGLNGLRNRSIEGAGPRPTGRLTPPLGFTDMNVVA